MDQLLCFEDVRRDFGGRPVLDRFSLSVRRGETVALVGRNGAGKSTALRVALGLLAVDAGRCTVFGRDSVDLHPSELDRIGVVAPFYRAPPFMRVRQALEFEAGTRSRFERTWAAGALGQLEIDEGTRMSELSNGQRTLVGLVLALAQRPRLLLLDEPTQGLDAIVRRQFSDALLARAAEGEMGILVASHHLSDVERTADRVALLHGGRCALDAEIEGLRGHAQSWRVRLAAGATSLPMLSGLAARRDTEDGIELTLMHLSPPERDALAAVAADLEGPRWLSLEEIFVALAGARGASFPELHEEVTR